MEFCYEFDGTGLVSYGVNWLGERRNFIKIDRAGPFCGTGFLYKINKIME